MLSDGFGDHAPTDDPEAVLADYTKWLHKVANSYLSPGHEQHDDLVQEGRIAMWRALDTYDPTKGSLPSWLTGAAKVRMKDVAHGHGQPTGKEAMRGRQEAKATDSVDALMEAGVEDMLGVSDALAGVEMSYHQGEIWKALEALSPAQRRYVIARFWMGLDPASRAPAMRELRKLVPELAKGFLWAGSSKQVGARDRLRHELSHLIDS